MHLNIVFSLAKSKKQKVFLEINFVMCFHFPKFHYRNSCFLHKVFIKRILNKAMPCVNIRAYVTYAFKEIITSVFLNTYI